MQPTPDNPGRFIILAGIVLVLIGIVVSYARTLRLGRLPGDIHWSGRGWDVWVPLGTSILLSLILTLVLNLLWRRR